MKRFIPLLMILLLAVILAFVLDDFVRQVIVAPLLFVLWFVGLFLQNLPQFVFWVLFILAALIILVKSLYIDIMWPDQSRKQKTSFARGVVAPWQGQLQRAERQPRFRWQLARSLAKLSQETLIPTEPLDADETQSMAVMIATLPPEIATYLQAELTRKPTVISPWYRRQSDQAETPMKLDPEMIVEFLEKETAWEQEIG